jgi:regulatory protein
MTFGRPRKLSREQLKEYAARLLGARALSTAELKEKLRRRAESAADVESVASQLKDLELLSDRRFAEHYASARAGAKSAGRQRTLADLLAKRVAPKVAEAAVARAYQDFDEVGAIEHWLERKFRARNLAEMLREPAKLAAVYRRLRVAGFSSANAIRVLKRHSTVADRLEEIGEDGPPGGEP